MQTHIHRNKSKQKNDLVYECIILLLQLTFSPHDIPHSFDTAAQLLPASPAAAPRPPATHPAQPYPPPPPSPVPGTACTAPAVPPPVHDTGCTAAGGTGAPPWPGAAAHSTTAARSRTHYHGR